MKDNNQHHKTPPRKNGHPTPHRILRHMARWRVATVLVILAVLWLTLAPHPFGEEEISIPLFPHADKVVHALMFAAVAAVALFEEHIRTSYPLEKGSNLRRDSLKVGATFLAVSLFGLAIEFAQRAMRLGRSFEWADFAADTTGAFIGVLTFVACRLMRHRR